MAKRVLHFVSAMHKGGAETLLMNLYRNIDRERLQFDFVTHSTEVTEYDLEIEKLGGKIYRIESLGKSGLIKYIKNIRTIIKENGYDIIHSHTNLQGGIVSFAGWLEKVPKRISHSHNTNWIRECGKVNKVLVQVLKYMIKLFSNEYFACGEKAAKYMFTKSILNKKKYIIINNGIDIDKFINIENEKIDKLKLEHGISDKDIVIGHVGRFHPQKNHKFIIDVAKAVIQENDKYKFILIGEGEGFDEINKNVIENKLTNNIKLIGIKSNINEYMNLFDALILPSLYEGLPLVLVEAQSSDRICLISDRISEEVDLGLNLVRFLNIKSKDKWKSEILSIKKYSYNNEKSVIKEKITEYGYNIKESIEEIYKIYL